MSAKSVGTPPGPGRAVAGGTAVKTALIHYVTGGSEGMSSRDQSFSNRASSLWSTVWTLRVTASSGMPPIDAHGNAVSTGGARGQLADALRNLLGGSVVLELHGCRPAMVSPSCSMRMTSPAATRSRNVEARVRATLSEIRTRTS